MIVFMTVVVALAIMMITFTKMTKH